METPRQLVHLSGLLFVLLAQFTGSILAAFSFFAIAATFLIYSEYIKREKIMLAGFLEAAEKRLRNFITKFERTGTPRPFLGAFWFYAGCGFAFLLFPLPVASAACSILAVGDSLSTIFGKKFGRHKLIGSKTAEGSAVFFAGAVLISLVFVNPLPALAGSAAAAIAELLPDVHFLFKAKGRGFVDDNLLIPIVAGFIMLLI